MQHSGYKSFDRERNGSERRVLTPERWTRDAKEQTEQTRLFISNPIGAAHISRTTVLRYAANGAVRFQRRLIYGRRLQRDGRANKRLAPRWWCSDYRARCQLNGRALATQTLTRSEALTRPGILYFCKEQNDVACSYSSRPHFHLFIDVFIQQLNDKN